MTNDNPDREHPNGFDWSTYEAEVADVAEVERMIGAWRDMAWTTVSALIVIALWQSGACRLLRPLVPAGRMTLTFYVGQSLLFVPVFYGFGLGLHGEIGQARALALGVAAFAAQLLLAGWWMRHFRYGPLEYGWRAFTFTTTRIPFR